MDNVVEYHSPPYYAKKAGVASEKITGFIEAGELRAYNFAAKQGGRPRYRIAESDWREFLERRAAAVQPALPRRSRQKQVARRFY